MSGLNTKEWHNFELIVLVTELGFQANRGKINQYMLIIRMRMYIRMYIHLHIHIHTFICTHNCIILHALYKYLSNIFNLYYILYTILWSNWSFIVYWSYFELEYYSNDLTFRYN